MKRTLKGRYQVTDKLGKGGSGQVYKIWDMVLEKEWALKEFFEKDGIQEKNMELQVLKKLSHPCFPRIVDVFEEEERTFFVMDYIKGRTLKELLQQTSFSEEQILELGIKIAEALLFLHQLTPSLLYLDLKPSNIIVEEEGGVKLVDFGSVIVKGKRVAVSGTPGYASPEQIHPKKEGQLLSEQSDIYSLGMVLFSMISGGTESMPVVSEEESRGISIRKYQPIISRKTERLLEKATRGNREKRYGSMRELLSDMRKSREELRKSKRRRMFGKRKAVEAPFWHQEKSILCCDGKTISCLRKAVLAGMLLLFLFGQNTVEAKENTQFKVFIKDEKGRKVLVKKGSSYEVKNNLYFEIPGDMMEEEFQIQIHCLKEGEKIGEFFVDCKKVD